MGYRVFCVMIMTGGAAMNTWGQASWVKFCGLILALAWAVQVAWTYDKEREGN